MPTCSEAIALLKHYKMPPFQNGKKCSGYVLSSKMCEIWDGYRLVVLQWFHVMHLRSVVRLRMIETISCNPSDVSSRYLCMVGYHASRLCTASPGRGECHYASSVGDVSQDESAIDTRFPYIAAWLSCSCCAAAVCVLALRRIMWSVALISSEAIRSLKHEKPSLLHERRKGSGYVQSHPGCVRSGIATALWCRSGST